MTVTIVFAPATRVNPFVTSGTYVSRWSRKG